MCRYHKTLEPGMNVLVPLMDKVKYVHSLKEITVDIPLQIAVSSGETLTPSPSYTLPSH